MSENLPPSERPKSSRPLTSSWELWAALGLILLGGFFLLQNLGVSLPFPQINWWALFMLIPAGMILNKVWASYKANGDQLVGEARSQLVVGLMIVAIALFFLFEFAEGLFWPLLLIAGGVLVLFGALKR
jgi:hypothetical protein